MSEKMTEHTAMILMQKGDEIGLQRMIEIYTPYVSSIIWGIVGGNLTIQDAEEITADTFIEMWRYRDRLLEGKVKGYLGAIARHQAINRLRKAGQVQPLLYDEQTVEADTPEREVLVRESRQLLLHFLDAMKPDDREIFLRYYYFYENTPSIARHMDMNPDAVRQRLSRGREHLRKLFEEEWAK